MSAPRGLRAHPDKAHATAVRRAKVLRRLIRRGYTGPGIHVAHGYAANA